MPDYMCETCGKTFKQKGHLDYHIEHNACKEHVHRCRLCNKGFTTATSMYRHVRTSCAVKNKDEENKIQIYEKLIEINEKTSASDKQSVKRSKKTIDHLQNEVETLKREVKVLQSSTNTGTTITNNVINVNTFNNINLVGYGNEDISKLDRGDMLKILRHGYNSTIKLTEAIHFNPMYPEYHNVYISNMKDKYAMMFDGKAWTLTMKEELIDKIYSDKKNYIEENLDVFLDSLSTSRKKALERWLENDDDDKKIKSIKESIKLMLYNSKHIVMDTQKKNCGQQIMFDDIKKRSTKKIKYTDDMGDS
jgi:hypothetical protein